MGGLPSQLRDNVLFLVKNQNISLTKDVLENLISKLSKEGKNADFLVVDKTISLEKINTILNAEQLKFENKTPDLSAIKPLDEIINGNLSSTIEKHIKDDKVTNEISTNLNNLSFETQKEQQKSGFEI